jgi:Na+/proline symporter
MADFKLHWIDQAIVFTYVALTIVIGFWISKRASQNLRNYFLGGNTLPWYVLGLSNASGMFDISGTMLIVYWLFIYGAKSVWIPWLWPVFNQVFAMVFLSIWLRRSGVMTGAEWIRFRFGDGRGAHLAHFIVVLFALVNVVGFLAYGFIGIGKFAAEFLPWQLAADHATNVNAYGLIITAITTLYVVKGGMYSVVFTEVLQFAFMTVACVWVGIVAMQQVSPSMLDAVVPAGWKDIFFGSTLDLDWSTTMDAASASITKDGWEWFSLFVGLMFFKGALQSVAGPAPNYDMQRVLSARTPREAAYMSGFVNVVLLVPRYMLAAGLTVLALVFFADQLNAEGNQFDFELILPIAIGEFMPVGLRGMLVAALLAAFMSTYAATVNAAPAYVVNDIYKRYLNPHASDKTYVAVSYLTSIVVVILGTACGFFTESLSQIVNWIVTALYGGYTAANLLKWIWWRFNSYGYFWGMAAGMLSAGLVPQLYAFLDKRDILARPADIYMFPLILVLSMAGCLIGTLFTPPDDVEVLKKFYRQVRPWGFWGPIHDLVVAEHPETKANTDFKRDMFNVLIGIAWQTALTAVGIFLVIKDYEALGWSLGVVLVTSTILKFTWFNKIQEYPSDLAGENKEGLATPSAVRV